MWCNDWYNIGFRPKCTNIVVDNTDNRLFKWSPNILYCYGGTWIPIIITSLIRLSTAAYLIPRLIPRHNLSCSIPAVRADQSSSSVQSHSSENSSKGKNAVVVYLSRRKKVRRYLGIIEERYGRCGRNGVTERRRRWKMRRKRRDGGGII